MKKIAIIGAGQMTKPMVDYFVDTCGYQVLMLNRTLSRAEKITANRPQAKAIEWPNLDPKILDRVINNADVVISMVPKPLHPNVAASCLRNKKHMLTTSYETPELLALDQEFKANGIMILNELGEVPGIDHFGTQMLLDEIREQGGNILAVRSYGSGLPAMEYNTNPLQYKFSWDPSTVFMAARTGAAYYEKGKRIEVPGEQLFNGFWLVDIQDLATFETYPNKDCKKYLKPFGLDNTEDITFYRGLLRYSGYCNTLKNIKELGLMDCEKKENYRGKTHRQWMTSLIGADSNAGLERTVAKYLHVHDNADIIHRLRWLGLFDDNAIQINEGTSADILLDRMLKKMAYQPHEKDMIIVHIEVEAEFPGKGREKRLATMVAKGIPFGDSAMSRAVALPAAIAARLITEGKINGTGLLMPPTIPELYPPVLAELENFGFSFKRQIKSL